MSFDHHIAGTRCFILNDLNIGFWLIFLLFFINCIKPLVSNLVTSPWRRIVDIVAISAHLTNQFVMY